MRVSFPAIGDGGEFRISGQAMHDAQLHDMQPVIKGTRDHGESGAGLLVQRPESKIVAIEIANQRLNSEQKKILSGGFPRGKKIIVDAPGAQMNPFKIWVGGETMYSSNQRSPAASVKATPPFSIDC